MSKSNKLELININIDRESKNKLISLSNELNISLSALGRIILKEYIDNNNIVITNFNIQPKESKFKITIKCDNNDINILKNKAKSLNLNLSNYVKIVLKNNNYKTPKVKYLFDRNLNSKLTILLSKDDKNKLESRIKELNLSKNKYIRDILINHIESYLKDNNEVDYYEL